MNTKIRQETDKDYQDVFKVTETAFTQEDESRLVERIRCGRTPD